MWTPGAVFVLFSLWFLAANDSLSAGRKLLLGGFGVLPAALLYGALGMMAVSGWSSTQRIRVHGDLIRKQYPLGPFESFSLPVWTRLGDIARCSVQVEPHFKDERGPDNRPAFRDRLVVVGKGRKLLTFGPTLTVAEAERIAETLNSYFAEKVSGQFEGPQD
jgi:hypothetical protein